MDLLLIIQFMAYMKQSTTPLDPNDLILSNSTIHPDLNLSYPEQNGVERDECEDVYDASNSLDSINLGMMHKTTTDTSSIHHISSAIGVLFLCLQEDSLYAIKGTKSVILNDQFQRNQQEFYAAILGYISAGLYGK